jgi:hypothetical protein
LRYAILLISILLGVIPLAGVGWIVATRSITTVDGLFMSLILVTLSGIFFLNVFFELRDVGFLGFLKRKKPEPKKAPPVSEAG